MNQQEQVQSDFKIEHIDDFEKRFNIDHNREKTIEEIKFILDKRNNHIEKVKALSLEITTAKTNLVRKQNLEEQITKIRSERAKLDSRRKNIIYRLINFFNKKMAKEIEKKKLEEETLSKEINKIINSYRNYWNTIISIESKIQEVEKSISSYKNKIFAVDKFTSKKPDSFAIYVWNYAHNFYDNRDNTWARKSFYELNLSFEEALKITNKEQYYKKVPSEKVRAVGGAIGQVIKNLNFEKTSKSTNNSNKKNDLIDLMHSNKKNALIDAMKYMYKNFLDFNPEQNKAFNQGIEYGVANTKDIQNS